ncbi:hypothetical protein FE257_010764 [Aspergillus nanangensis]|uniref:Transaldolase n=1 Tax=Aspergillus nanangensis TaxID=2582783 RepID=A0AAD4CVY5_ASPNN|nr:hypothetical protein FE257_010764 [Aspergillus nanangensis]
MRSPTVNRLTETRISGYHAPFDHAMRSAWRNIQPSEADPGWETFEELSKPKHVALIKSSIAQSRELSGQFAGVGDVQLTVEIAMIKLSLEAARYVTGNVHVMANPEYAFSTPQIVQTGLRFHRLFRLINPGFDCARIVMKVPATWEGLQACRQLTHEGIKTLATTVFTFPQVVLAGEVGCTSISPFVHSLRLFAMGATEDPDAIFDLVLRAQNFYRTHGVKTAVKACAVFNGNEAVQLAGVDALTLPPDTLDELRQVKTGEPKPSLFDGTAPSDCVPYISSITEKTTFTKSMTMDAKNGTKKLDEAIALFCDYQRRAEGLIQSHLEG